MSGQRVQLYVYDLSRGMAKSMSLGLTGRQIDGIWHTSVVVYGREIFYGRGIMEAAPGTTHHGTPQQIIECGETQIDPDTFQEYLFSLSEYYTPNKYHLIDFNCNNFTADVIGFLTGTEIPSWISGLPAEFLTTPLGQMIKPQIDAMFGATSGSEHSAFDPSPVPAPAAPATPPPAPPAAGAPNDQNLAASFLQAVAAAAAGGSRPQGAGEPAGVTRSIPETSALTLVTSQANFNSIMSNNKAVIVNFTNTAGCPPCRMIKPAYEALAETHHATYGPKGTRFVEVEMGVGEGHAIAGQYGVSATPTFMFFKEGKKVNEVQGADKRGIEQATERLLDDCFPVHPHKRKYLAATQRISTQPITATTTPAFTALLTKLESFAGASPEQVGVLRTVAIPILEGKTMPNAAAIDQWTSATTALLGSLKPAEAFPVVDLWRIGLLKTPIIAALAGCLSSSGSQPIGPILSLTASTLQGDKAAAPRPLLLTTLRLATNLLAPLPLANLVLGTESTVQTDLLSVLVDSLLHPEVSVRKAAADVAVNAAAWRHRVAKERAAAGGSDDEEGLQADWELELLTALLEGIGRESDPDVGHRLLAASALLIYLSPSYEEGIKPLLDVLGARATLEDAGKRWGKADVRKLADEVATRLC